MKFTVCLALLPLFIGVTMAEAKTEKLVLGGGCFWCTEAAYKLIPGVLRITCGYAGGTADNPSYEDVCTGTTGHAEVIRIEYDPAKVSLERLLEHFWVVHNPVQVGGQGNDVGTQYRSIILYASAAQKAAAEKSKAEAQKRFSEPITTEIVPLQTFWPAEDYHQNYFAKHPEQGYCSLVIAPKIKHLKEELADRSKVDPATTGR
jgi:peptide-methionine (S)-S-oxide reductase